MNFKPEWIWHPLKGGTTRLLDSMFVWLDARIAASKRRRGIVAIGEPRDVPRAAPEAQPEYPVITQSMNLTRRARAMHMRRRGDEPHTIAAALGISHGEVELLFKLDRIFQQRQ
jgi:hypothetical protein